MLLQELLEAEKHSASSSDSAESLYAQLKELKQELSDAKAANINKLAIAEIERDITKVTKLIQQTR